MDNNLVIDLYRSCCTQTDIYSKGVCHALRAKYPMLADKFKQIDLSVQHFEETINHVTKEEL